MEEIIFFDSAKESVTNFFEKEFENFPALMMSHFLNRFNDILDYTEEDNKILPKIIFTNSIESVEKSIPKSDIIYLFEDDQPTMFNSRIKSILALMKEEWCVFVDIKENKIRYGLVVAFRSIKDKSFLTSLEENSTLKDKQPKISCIIAHPLNSYTMSLHSISGNNLLVNFSLDKSKNGLYSTEIGKFVNSAFSKLRTTQQKLQDMKNMYINIFTKVLSNVKGSICVIVDKDYVDNGLFEDGIWLKEPLNFSKLFNQTKSFSEGKLRAYSDLFFNMLNYDGITIIDNQGRLRAYNVFVEPSAKRVGFIVGGARKRAAYYILSSKKKGLVGVYFQSHEGEVFYQDIVPDNKKAKSPKSKPQPKID